MGPSAKGSAAASARAARALVNASAGGLTRPAPTCPVPATRPAIPVLTTGSTPVLATSVTSIPTGVPRKPSPGIW